MFYANGAPGMEVECMYGTFNFKEYDSATNTFETTMYLSLKKQTKGNKSTIKYNIMQTLPQKKSTTIGTLYNTQNNTQNNTFIILNRSPDSTYYVRRVDQSQNHEFANPAIKEPTNSEMYDSYYIYRVN
jgi:hypothetical protein